jgi:hypothetical protein
VAANDLTGVRQILRLCDESAQLEDPETLAGEFERSRTDSDAERQAIIDEIAQVLDAVDKRSFEASMRTLRNGGLIDSDIPSGIRAGRVKPQDIFRRACENADERRLKLPYRSEAA